MKIFIILLMTNISSSFLKAAEIIEIPSSAQLISVVQHIISLPSVSTLKVDGAGVELSLHKGKEKHIEFVGTYQGKSPAFIEYTIENDILNIKFGFHTDIEEKAERADAFEEISELDDSFFIKNEFVNFDVIDNAFSDAMSILRQESSYLVLRIYVPEGHFKNFQLNEGICENFFF